MNDVNDNLTKMKLDIACKQLSKALDNETACDRYMKQSHVTNRLSKEESYTYKDIRGFEHYVR